MSVVLVISRLYELDALSLEQLDAYCQLIKDRKPLERATLARSTTPLLHVSLSLR